MSKIIKTCPQCGKRIVEQPYDLCWGCMGENARAESLQKKEELAMNICAKCLKPNKKLASYGVKKICGECILKIPSFLEVYNALESLSENNEMVKTNEINEYLGRKGGFVSHTLTKLYKLDLIDRKRTGRGYSYFMLGEFFKPETLNKIEVVPDGEVIDQLMNENAKLSEKYNTLLEKYAELKKTVIDPVDAQILQRVKSSPKLRNHPDMQISISLCDMAKLEGK